MKTRSISITRKLLIIDGGCSSSCRDDRTVCLPTTYAPC